MNFSLPRFARSCTLLLGLAGTACAPFSTPSYDADDGADADAAVASLAEDCATGICLDDDALDRMLAAQVALQSCVPDAEQDFAPSEGEGLAIADVSVVEDADGWLVEVLFANTSPAGVWTYPSTSLEVVEGDALVATVHGDFVSEADAAADMQLYGIEPCSAETHSYRLTWSDSGTAVLIAAALNNLGDDTKDSVKLALVRE